uniref:Cilia and flagella associated protein 90 n=1 Tax=Anabas testudineus TaxID=64144 RepID=A0AAQ6IUT9_ANATE
MDVVLEAKSKPLSTLSAFSYIPPRRKETKQISPAYTGYSDLNQKLHRDDRKHYKGTGLNINKEEKSRDVAVLSSSEYGRRPVPDLYQPGRQFAHVACIKTEFYMKNGIIWNVAEGYGSVAPI